MKCSLLCEIIGMMLPLNTSISLHIYLIKSCKCTSKLGGLGFCNVLPVREQWDWMLPHHLPTELGRSANSACSILTFVSFEIYRNQWKSIHQDTEIIISALGTRVLKPEPHRENRYIRQLALACISLCILLKIRIFRGLPAAPLTIMREVSIQ